MNDPFEQEREDLAVNEAHYLGPDTEHGHDNEEEPEADICPDCDHKIGLHGRYGCEYEQDRWVSGLHNDALMAVPCGCKTYEVLK